MVYKLEQWTFLVFIIIFNKSVSSQGLPFMLKNKNGDQYYNYYCGSRIQLNEKQELLFYFPEQISSFRCVNALNNHSVNITKDALKFQRTINAIVDEFFDGAWKCTVFTASAQGMCCVVTFEVIYDMKLKIKGPETVTEYPFNREYRIGSAVMRETVNYKEGDLFEFKCELPGVKNILKTGQLSWRGCVYANETDCKSMPPVKMPSMQTSSPLEVDLNSSTVECVYTTASGLTSVIEVQLNLLDLVPPDFIAITGHAMVDVNDTYSYGGRLGDEVIVVCLRREERRSVVITCCKSDQCAACHEGIMKNNSVRFEYRFNLTESWRGMSVNCAYAEASSKGKTIVFDVVKNHNLVQSDTQAQAQQSQKAEPRQQEEQSQQTQQSEHAEQSQQTQQRRQSQESQQAQQSQHVQQAQSIQQEQQAQQSYHRQETETQTEQSTIPPTPGEIHVFVKGFEPVEATEERYVYHVVNGDTILLRCRSSDEVRSVDLQCCQPDSYCSACDSNGLSRISDGSVQYMVRSSKLLSLVQLRCAYTEIPSIGKSIVFKVHSQKNNSILSAEVIAMFVGTCALLTFACAATTALVCRRRRARRPRPPLPPPEPLYYTVDEPTEELYYSYARPH